MRWLTEDIATAAYMEVSAAQPQQGVAIVDVRDLVDKQGNDPGYINTRIEEALALLKNNQKIIICCDYGMSRSNSIATGVLSRWKGISFAEAVRRVRPLIDEGGVKVEMLNTVYAALKEEEGEEVDKGRQMLVTGANGFIGKALLPVISQRSVVYSPSSKDIDLLDNALDLDLFIKSNHVGVIVHLANPKIFTTNRSLGDSLVILKNVLDVCRTNGTKLIYLSGWEIYSGYKSHGLLADERLAANPKGTYGETKWFCEQLVRQYGVMYGLKYQIIRSGPVYGPGGEKPKFLYNFIDKALSGKEIFTHRYINGSPMLDLLHIDDLVAAIDSIAGSSFEGEINLGSGVGISTLEIATLVCELTKSTSGIRQVPVNDYASNIIMDNSVARKTFGWSPALNIRAGIQQIINTITHNE